MERPRPVWADLAWRLRWLDRISLHGFSGREMALAWRLFDRFDVEEGGAYPGICKLEAELQVHEKTVRRTTESLVEAGFLRVVNRNRCPGGRRSDTNLYIPRLPEDLTGGHQCPADEPGTAQTAGHGCPMVAPREAEPADIGVPDHRAPVPEESFLEKPSDDDAPEGAAVVVCDGNRDTWPSEVADLHAALARAGGLTLEGNTSLKGAASAQAALSWRAKGYSFTQDVVPTVRDTAAKQAARAAAKGEVWNVSTWAYFSAEVARAHRRRIADDVVPGRAALRGPGMLAPGAPKSSLGFGSAPEQVVALVCATLGEDLARSCLHSCRWDESRRAITPATGWQFSKLSERCQTELTCSGISLDHPTVHGRNAA